MSETIEELAAEYGWNAEGEKSAEEYVKVALEKFPDQSKKIKQLFRSIDELKTHMTKSEEKAYERAKADLDAQRKDAIRQGDVDEVERLDKEREQLLPQPVQSSEPQIPQAILDFEERNKEWIDGTSFEDLKMQQWVEDHGKVLGRKKLPIDEHMNLLEEHLKKEFAHRFETEENTEVKSPVSQSRQNVTGASKSKNSKITFNDLGPEQKKIARDFEQLGIMSVEQYIKDLVANGEL